MGNSYCLNPETDVGSSLVMPVPRCFADECLPDDDADTHFEEADTGRQDSFEEGLRPVISKWSVVREARTGGKLNSDGWHPSLDLRSWSLADDSIAAPMGHSFHLGYRLQSAFGAVPWMEEAEAAVELAGIPQGASRARPSRNGNRPSDYVWLQDAMTQITSNQGHLLPCVNRNTRTKYTPLLFMLGACPSMLAGMQAVMYCVDRAGTVDFWWVKPEKHHASKLERETLNRHSSGVFKNAPGRSRVFCEPLALLLEGKLQVDGWEFGVDMVCHSGTEVARAYMHKSSSDAPQPQKCFIYLFWQEDWSSNPWSRSPYIKGKIIYQKKGVSAQYFSRQYEFNNGTVNIACFEDHACTSVMPSDEVKVMWQFEGVVS